MVVDTPTSPVDDLVTQVQLCDSGVDNSDVGAGLSEVVPTPLTHVKHLQRTRNLTHTHREMDYKQFIGHMIVFFRTLYLHKVDCSFDERRATDQNNP